MKRDPERERGRRGHRDQFKSGRLEGYGPEKGKKATNTQGSMTKALRNKKAHLPQSIYGKTGLHRPEQSDGQGGR